MIRYIYTIINVCCYYNTLTNIAKNKNKIFDRITDMTVNDLINLNIKILALDFDGVLNSHGEPYPRADVIQWMKTIQAHLGAENMFILSNKPLEIRIDFFNEQFPGLEFIHGVRKKPYPDGLERIFKLKNLSDNQKQQVALVDDRFFTGILATCIAGCQGIYIRRPYIQFNSRPLSEFFFQLLRWLERRLLGLSY